MKHLSEWPVGSSTELEDRIRWRLYRLQLESGAVVTINAYNRADWHSPLYRAMPFHHHVEYEGIVW